MKTIAIDANIILRYLLADHPVFSKKAKELFKAAELVLLIGIFIN